MALYPDDASLWAPVSGQPNLGGTLTLHLCGNLRPFVGAVLGKSGYLRDRYAEFSQRGVSRAELMAAIDVTKAEITAALGRLSDAALDNPYPARGHRRRAVGAADGGGPSGYSLKPRRHDAEAREGPDSAVASVGLVAVHPVSSAPTVAAFLTPKGFRPRVVLLDAEGQLTGAAAR